MKRCSGCQAELPFERFGIDQSTKDGHAYRCLACQRERYRTYYRKNRDKRKADARAWKERNKEHIKVYRRSLTLKRYGLDESGFAALLLAQGNACAICRKTPPEDLKRRWHVDHDHETGQVRAVLCGKCNVLIGMADESPEVLQSAIAYLSEIDSKAGELH